MILKIRHLGYLTVMMSALLYYIIMNKFDIPTIWPKEIKQSITILRNNKFNIKADARQSQQLSLTKVSNIEAHDEPMNYQTTEVGLHLNARHQARPQVTSFDDTKRSVTNIAVITNTAAASQTEEQEIADGGRKPQDVNCLLAKKTNPNCLEYSFRRLLTPTWKCKDKVMLFMMVTSIPGNALKRNVLRKTWCSDLTSIYGRIQHIFILGSSNSTEEQAVLEKESQEHGDILQDDFVEHYRNMTIKTIMAYRWFHEHCKNVSYLMKCDDDMFINTPYLLRKISKKNSDGQNQLFGQLRSSSRIVRNPNHRWYVSYEQLRGTIFPDYCVGSAYVIGSYLAHQVAELMPSVPIFPVEDAYVGLCVKYLNGSVSQQPGFHLQTKYLSLAELLKLTAGRSAVTVHKADDSAVEILWTIALKAINYELKLLH